MSSEFNRLNQLGVSACQQGDFSAAIAYFQQALILQPENATLHNNLGNVLQEQGLLFEAATYYQKALNLQKNYVDAHINLATVLRKQGKFTEAIDHYHQALQIKPDSAEAYNSLGLAFLEIGNIDQAIESGKKAIEIYPDYASAYNNLGTFFAKKGDLEQAIAHYQISLKIRPNSPETHKNLSLALLLKGDLQQGFAEYEWRFLQKYWPQRVFSVPRWQGESLEGKTILIHAEQGLGDTLQFIRYMPFVKAKGGTLMVECQKPLLRLLEGVKAIDQLIPQGAELPPFDVHVPLLSVPHILGTTLETIPAEIPYLVREAGSGNLSVLNSLSPVPKIGIVWAGSAENKNDRNRSCGLTHFLPLLEIPNLEFYSLQKEIPAADMPLLKQSKIRDLSDSLQDFAATADIISQLDLVISVDTAVAHLAGALGKPAWVVLSSAVDWRWMLEREDSPWYPTLRLFRQRELGNWEEVFERVQEALPQWLIQENSYYLNSIHLSISDIRKRAAVHYQEKKWRQAKQSYQQILAALPTDVNALNMLGIIALEFGQLKEAIIYFENALTLLPHSAEIYYNLGNALQKQGELDAAITNYQQAVALKPDYVKAHFNLGLVLHQQGQREAAITHYEQVISLQPSYAAVYINWGAALNELGQHTAAISCYQQALTLRSNDAGIYYNLANAYRDQGEIAEAIACYRHAITVNPDYAEAHWGLALVLLRSGDFAAGFQEYEWRWRRPDSGLKLKFSEPIWQGSDLAGKTLLVYAEQGLGDTLQFIRYVPLVAKNGRVIVECHPPLLRLLETVDGIEMLVPQGGVLPTFDLQVPLMSLPRILGTTVATIPAAIPYLSPPSPHPILSLSPETINIGLVWGCNPSHPTSQQRSCPLAIFANLLEIPGVRWYSLQKDAPAADLALLQSLPIEDLSDQLQDFADTAAILSQLDLVITVDTAAAHLAGALGEPAWVLLPVASDWRWMLDREDSPWYPTLRLFRQQQPGDWQGVIAQVKAALQGNQLKIKQDARVRQSQKQSSINPKSAAGKSRYLHAQAIAYHESGNLAAAEQICRQILAQQSPDFEVLHLLGVILGKMERMAEAIAYLEQAIALNPTHINVRHNLGILYYCQGNFTAAITQYQAAFNLDPNHGETCFYLGKALLAVDAHNAEGYYYLGWGFNAQDNITDAIASYQQAIALNSQYVAAHFNLAHIFMEQGKLNEAIFHYQQVLNLQPNHIEAHYNFAHALLLAGDLQRGFVEYEWRLKRPDWSLPQRSEPLWDGSPLTGKTILLYAEQGLGDTMQFIRYVPLIAKLGGQIIVECQTPLLRLLKNMAGIHQLVERGNHSITCDVQVPLLSLPRILGTTLETIPSEVPYLIQAATTGNQEERMREAGKKSLLISHPSAASNLDPQFADTFITTPPTPVTKIGIVWAGSFTDKPSRNRSCSLQHFSVLLEIPEIAVYSLQKDPSETDLKLLKDLSIPDLSQHLHDFADTAAMISQLDLVITIDTAVAHLAGALGKPVWVLLPFAPDWRWMLKRQDSPWYPTLRLFRQPYPGDWQPVFAQVKLALKVHQNLTLNPQESSSLPQRNPLSQRSSPPPTNQSLKFQRLGICWPLNLTIGWGIYGINLTLELLKRRDCEPTLLVPPSPNITSSIMNPLHQTLLQPILEQQRNFQQRLEHHSDKQLFCNFPVLHPLGNTVEVGKNEQRMMSDHLVGVIFLENTQLSPDALARAKKYSLMITGSTWNEKVLKSYGLTSVKTIQQGIDPTLFHGAAKSNLFSNRFVIFSGGKLEYRKGQDIIIAAFKHFHQRHPEALLLTAWHNFWPDYMQGIDQTGYVMGLPKVGQNQRLEIIPWLVANGLTADSLIDVGVIPNYLVPQVLREADVAVFTNRCEGGTNLVAMESMACGIPTILSANTGHLDLIHENHCYPLNTQGMVKPISLFSGVDGWGESSVEEVIETLEIVYQNREAAKQRGLNAAQFMLEWTWEKQVSRLLSTLNEWF